MAALKVPIQEILDETEGMLQKQLYVVFTTAVAGMEEKVMEVSEAHIAFQVGLEKRGIMFGAGPFWNEDEATWGGDGMVIIRAGSLDEARAIAAEDPMHQAGARSYEIRPWLLNEGGFNLHVSFSDLKYGLELEVYEGNRYAVQEASPRRLPLQRRARDGGVLHQGAGAQVRPRHGGGQGAVDARGEPAFAHLPRARGR